MMDKGKGTTEGGRDVTSLIHLNGLSKVFYTEEVETHALSEIHLDIDFDYVAYTTENLTRFERAYAEFKDM